MRRQAQEPHAWAIQSMCMCTQHCPLGPVHVCAAPAQGQLNHTASHHSASYVVVLSQCAIDCGVMAHNRALLSMLMQLPILEADNFLRNPWLPNPIQIGNIYQRFTSPYEGEGVCNKLLFQLQFELHDSQLLSVAKM